MKRKKILTLLLICSFSFLNIKGSTTVVKAESANGFRIEQVFSDKFNKEELDSNWKLNGATLELNYSGLHCVSPVPYGSGPIINAAKLADKTQINFTIYPQSGQGETNISFNIGMETPSTQQKEPDVDCRIQFWNDQLVFCDWQHNLAVNQDKLDEHVLRGFKGLYSDLLRTDVSLYIERKSAAITEIYAEYRRNGEIVYTSKSTPFQLLNPRCPNGYCGFFWDVVEMDLTNFEMYNNGQLVFQDSLQTNTLTYPSTDYALGNFHINDALNESNCYYSKVSSVKMDSQNESIMNTNTLVKLDNVSNPYELRCSLKANKIAANSFYGFGFKLNEDDTSIDKTNAIGFIKNDDLTAEVVLLKNGVIDRSNNYQISLLKLANGKYVDYTIEFDHSNNAYLTIGGLTYKFANVDFYGNVGVGLVNLNGQESSEIEMREFSLYRNVYNKHDSEDASNDFQGTMVPDASEPFYTTPYLNNQKYVLGSGVSLDEDWTSGKQTLTFSNAGPYSRFGYGKEYSEWICEFDVELYTFRQGNMFGLSFGRKSLFDVLLPASTSNNTFLLRNDGHDTVSITYGINCKFEDGSTYKINPINIFDPDNNKYHMMFVGKNRTVYVYYKAIDAPDEELGILRTKIPNVNVDGYVAIVGNNDISFGVSNYKMVNLQDDCTKESELTLRESFDDSEKISNKLVLEGTSKVEDKMLVMNDSSIKMADENLFEMIRFTAQEIENDLQISFSKDKKIIFDIKNHQIIIKEGETSYPYDVSKMNLDYVKGKRFEITIIGDTVNIGYKNYYDPLDKLSETQISHTLSSPLSKDKISFSSNGKSAIDDLYLFSLDNSKECLTLNYEDDPNNAEIWKVKPDFDPSKVYNPDKKENTSDNKGCKGSIDASLFTTFALGLVSILALKRKKEER